MNSQQIAEAELLGSLAAEDTDLEFKAAQGKDGRGALPNDFWESYSAMANTDGGVVLLGVEERPRGHFRVVGIANYGHVRKQLWDCLNDRDKVSANLLLERDVRVLEVETGQGIKPVVQVAVPRASRKQRPVHVTKNPFGNTYLRRTEGDYRADDEQVRRMIAEQVEDERDSRILTSFGLSDLDEASLRQFRIEFANKRPAHVFANLEDREFLRNLGAFRRDRESGGEGLTAAGLLMFGRLPAIREQYYYYELDYQERSEPSDQARWTDRITTDGSWSGNLYDFYRIVIQRLFKDLKVPFSHDGLSRNYQTPIHEALQEALTNSLIHADYTGRVSVLVVKRPDLFGFRNPGRMRIPLKDALAGGHSDCRNRLIQTMFQLIGLGDKAGSGVPTILRNWTIDQHFRWPLLQERADPEQTLLTLPTISLIPDSTKAKLSGRFGEPYHRLPHLHRLALATAQLEGRVTHSRLADMSTDHSADLSACLRELVLDGFLEAHGAGRGRYYQITGTAPEDDFIGFPSFPQPPKQSEPDPHQKVGGSTSAMQPFGEGTQPSRIDMHLFGGRERHGDSEEWQELVDLAEEARKKKKMDVEPIILRLCRGRFLSRRELVTLLNRTDLTLRNKYLGRMVKEGTLEMRYPDRPTSPLQAYKSSEQTEA